MKQGDRVRAKTRCSLFMDLWGKPSYTAVVKTEIDGMVLLYESATPWPLEKLELAGAGRPRAADDLQHPNQQRALGKGWIPITVAYDLDSTVKTPEGLTEKDMFARAKAPLGDLAREVLTDKGTELWKAGRWDD